MKSYSLLFCAGQEQQPFPWNGLRAPSESDKEAQMSEIAVASSGFETSETRIRVPSRKLMLACICSMGGGNAQIFQ